ncbi:MAG: YceD family protein [Steroidobacteraceae bacterium]|jgi:uncharacterized protein|nr:hypothetical protein [Gammaproteobacteria bacterium]
MRRDWSRPVDVERLADLAEHLAVSVPAVEMPRLRDVLSRPEGTVSGDLRFARRKGRPMVQVSVQAKLPLRCQRCLQPVWVEVAGESEVWFVSEESEADGLEPSVEPTLAPQWKMAPQAVLEEELLLAMPLIPRHGESEQCQPTSAIAPDEAAVQRPFADLGKLLQRDS